MTPVAISSFQLVLSTHNGEWIKRGEENTFLCFIKTESYSDELKVHFQTSNVPLSLVRGRVLERDSVLCSSFVPF